MTAKSVFSFVQIAKFLVATTTIALTFVACGDDSGNSNDANNENTGNTFDEIREVATTQDLGRCTSEREGTPILVNANGVTYLCENLDWSVYVPSEANSSPADSSSATDFSIIPEYTEIADIMQLVKCSEESANAVVLVKKDTSYYTCANGNWIKSEEHGYVIQKRSILGVAQKGPFKFGAPVYLRELAGDDLHYTGKIYKDEISSNKGDFVIPNVNLIYPYASVEVRGLYRNEVTGKYSDVELSLFTLTDLQTDNRTKVNVNLLTHLEYVRAMHLVRKGYSVYAAKRQADQEIMTAFELPTTVKFSEDLSVFEDSEDDNVDYANASLMVLNLLFLGERSDAEVVALIDSFAKDFEKDGVWDDDSTKAAMADFATEINGDEIRANVKAWNILDIPAFESQMEMFWNNVYGLGGCTSVRNGVIANNKNKFSKNFEVYYKCSAGSWIKATQLEYDTYGWEAGTTGEVKKGDVTDAKYVYRNGAWNEASVEESGLGSCLAKNAGTILTYESDYYVCKSSEWTKLTIAQADTYGWTAGEVGEVKKGTYTDAKYVYRSGKWGATRELETLLGSCTTKNAHTTTVKNGSYYACEYTQWKELKISEADTYGWEAGETGEVKKGTYTDAKYVYRGGKWYVSDELETLLGSCVATNANTVTLKNGSYYACEYTLWKKLSVSEADTYGWAAGEVGEVKKGTYTDAKYVYRNYKWGAASELETLLGSCVAGNAGTVSLSGDTYYICKTNKWTEASVFEYDTYGWNAGETGEVKKGDVTDAKYVYRGGKWGVASELETLLGSCVAGNAGIVNLSGSKYYICKANEWTEASVFEYDTYGWTAGETGEVKKGNATDAKYVYRNSKWNAANELETSLGSCVAGNAGIVNLSGSKYYICKANEWIEASVFEYDTYGWTAGEVGEVKKGDVTDAKYVYRGGKWGVASELEALLGSCVAGNANTVTFKNSSYYACENTQWKLLSDFEADTYGWAAGETGEVKKGDVSEAKYVYRNSKWGTANELETLLGSCVTKNAETITLSSGTYYICKANEWTEASVLEYDTYGWNAGETGEVKKGDVSEAKYVYRNSKWGTASELETLLGSCIAENMGTVSLSGGAYYICKANEWTEASILEYDTYGLTCTRDGVIISGVVNTNNEYVCDNEVFRAVSTEELDRNLGCTSYTQGAVDTVTANTLYVTRWICVDKWKTEKIDLRKTMTDARDGQTYKIVTIGTQTWMAENLNYNYNQGTAVSLCRTNGLGSCVKKYGRFYRWSAAMDSASVFSTAGSGCGYKENCASNGTVRGVCPEGWHLPSENEWATLFAAVGGSNVAATNLKSSNGWATEIGSGTDSYGFSALPAGLYSYYWGSFRDLDSTANFWSSTEYNSTTARDISLKYEAKLEHNLKYNAKTIRCIQDSN